MYRNHAAISSQGARYAVRIAIPVSSDAASTKNAASAAARAAYQRIRSAFTSDRECRRRSHGDRVARGAARLEAIRRRRRSHQARALGEHLGTKRGGSHDRHSLSDVRAGAAVARVDEVVPTGPAPSRASRRRDARRRAPRRRCRRTATPATHAPSGPAPRTRISPPRLIAALSKRSQSVSASQPFPTPPRSMAQPGARAAHPSPISRTAGSGGTGTSGAWRDAPTGCRRISVIDRSYPAAISAGRQAAFTRPSLTLVRVKADAEQLAAATPTRGTREPARR